MQGFYELIRSDRGYPIKLFVHSINHLNMHWHNAIEILLVLQGSIQVRLGSELYVLKENDLIVINSYEVHNTNKITDDNIILALQIDPKYYSTCDPRFNRVNFYCKSFQYEKNDQEKFDMIRHHLAKIVWEFNKKREGYLLLIGSELNLLGAHLINHFEHSFLEEDQATRMHKDVERLQNIIDYIDDNIDKKITLQEIADREELSFYYLSHFIKEKLGISFQEYINFIRLDKATHLLSTTDKTITEISYASGFPSTKSLNRLFKEAYNCTPTEYRKENNSKTHVEDDHIHMDKKKSMTYLDVDRNSAFKKLFMYLKPLENEQYNLPIITSTKKNISIDATKKGSPYNPYWKRLTTFGRAAEGLRANWQNQLTELQKEIGFEYIRFHGIFSDEMMICNLNDNGQIVYNWTYVDELFDFFQKVNIKPFIELGFMPSELKKSDETIFWWRANISGPKEIQLWRDLIVAFIRHCINRYGLQEVKTWYFEVWNEPELEYVYWLEGKEGYFEFYKESALAVKSVSNELKVGGPSITHQTFYESHWLEDFIAYCSTNNVPLDFISIHIYPEFFSSQEDIQSLMTRLQQGETPLELMDEWNSMKRIYFEKNHTYDVLQSTYNKTNQILGDGSDVVEIHVTEWNASAYGRNLIHDTSFVATFIIHNVLKCIGKTNSLGYWTFTDIMEETKAGISPFHGGFGLINNHGLKKPSYFAYYLLSKLGDEIIDQGEEYIVTKKGGDIQILAYNYAYFDEFFLRGDTSALTNEERYLIYEEKPIKEINIQIQGIEGAYKIIKYELNREHGSVYDDWIRMGAPENMTEEEVSYLKGKAYPKVVVKEAELTGMYEDELHIPVHGVELMVLKRTY